MATRNWSANKLVDFLKRQTRQGDLTDAGDIVEGVSQETILQALNEGKRGIQYAVANAFGNAFATFETSTISSRQLQHEIPERAILDRIIKVEYSDRNTNESFYPLRKGDPQKNQYSEGSPYRYWKAKDGVVLEPSPASGYLRFLYQQEDHQLDVRRGTVEEVVKAGALLTHITLAADSYLNNINEEALAVDDWICVCDWQGDVQIYNIPITGYDSATRRIAVRSASLTYADEISVGDFVTLGKYTSTHSTLPFGFQDYFLTYGRYRLLNQDSNSDKIEEIPALQTIKGTIIEAIADGADQEEIPISGNVAGDWEL